MAQSPWNLFRVKGDLCLVGFKPKDQRRIKMKSREKRLEKTLRKLEKKRIAVINWLMEENVIVDTEGDYRKVLELSYEKLGWGFRMKRGSVSGFHARYSRVLLAIDGLREITVLFSQPGKCLVKKPKEIKSKRKEVENLSLPEEARIKLFYESLAWRRLRYKTLKKHGRRCQCCGAEPDDGVRINVDHILPIKKFWHLRLDPDNLQVLCGECNHGKGNVFTDDWRRSV